MMQIPFARPDITDAERQAVDEVLRSGWLTTGPVCARFEEEFARAVGAKHAVAVSSCTAALELALDALGVGEGDRVVVPSLTFAATAEVVVNCGARPVFADVRESDHTLDPEELHRLTKDDNESIVAYIPVNFGGQSCDFDALSRIWPTEDGAIEDAAHAHPDHRGRVHGEGRTARATCFSFYATKAITCGEGGMLVTDDEDIAERARMMRLHGLSRDAWRRYEGLGSALYEVQEAGFKANLPDVLAAIGLAQLHRAYFMLDARREIARLYLGAFRGHDAIETLAVRDFDDHAWHLFVIKLRPGVLSIDRDEFARRLRTKGVGCSMHFPPLHAQPYYMREWGTKPSDCPVALDVASRSISLPIYSAMTPGEAAYVAAAVLEVAKEARR
jgi:perosamine synthetase